jgi:hypothetical protein
VSSFAMLGSVLVGLRSRSRPRGDPPLCRREDRVGLALGHRPSRSSRDLEPAAQRRRLRSGHGCTRTGAPGSLARTLPGRESRLLTGGCGGVSPRATKDPLFFNASNCCDGGPTPRQSERVRPDQLRSRGAASTSPRASGPRTGDRRRRHRRRRSFDGKVRVT